MLGGATTAGSLAFSGAGKQVFLDDGAILAETSNGAITSAMTTALGTTPRYYFGLAANPTDSITVGAGTPWLGISTDRSSRNYNTATITANSDFFLQGLVVNNNATATFIGLGNNSSASAVKILPSVAGTPIKVSVIGTQLALNSDSNQFPNVTFIATPGTTVLPSAANSMGGSGTGNTATIANLIVQDGAFINSNSGTINNTINGNVYLEPGGVFVADDNILSSGVPNTFAGTGVITFTKGSRLDINGSPLGSITGTQTFNTAPGTVVRLNNLGNNLPVQVGSPVGISTRVGPDVYFEVFGGNSGLTTQTVNAANTPITPENVTLNGGLITNDSASRTLIGGYGGHIIVPASASATLAGTASYSTYNVNNALSTTYNGPLITFTFADHFDLGAGSTLNIGTTESVAGNPKVGTGIFTPVPAVTAANAVGSFGTVTLNPTVNNNIVNTGLGITNIGGVNTGTATSAINILAGAQLQLSAENVLPDAAIVNLGSATSGGVTTYSSLLLGAIGTETIGNLTGSGYVMATTGTAFVQVGFNNDNPVAPLAAVFSNLGGAQPNLSKIGTGNVNVTGVSTSTGIMTVNQGSLTLTGTGSVQFVAYPSTGANLIVNDTSVSGASARIRQLTGANGTLTLNGGNAAVIETVSQFNTAYNIAGSGGGVLQINPGAGGFTLAATTFQSSSGVNAAAVYILRGTGIGTAPAGTANAATFTVPTLASANLTGGGATLNPTAAIGIFGTAGTPNQSIRPDVLIDSSTNGSAISFGTEDPTSFGATTGNYFRPLTAGEYYNTIRSSNVLAASQASATNYNILAGSALTYSADSQINSVTFAQGGTLTGTANSRLLVKSGGILVPAGVTGAAINAGMLQNSTNQPFLITNFGDLSINGSIVANQSLVKAGSGTLNLGAGGAAVLSTGKRWRRHRCGKRGPGCANRRPDQYLCR